MMDGGVVGLLISSFASGSPHACVFKNNFRQDCAGIPVPYSSCEIIFANGFAKMLAKLLIRRLIDVHDHPDLRFLFGFWLILVNFGVFGLILAKIRGFLRIFVDLTFPWLYFPILRFSLVGGWV